MKRTFVVVMFMYVVGQCLPSGVSDDNGTCEISNRCQTILKSSMTRRQIGGETWALAEESAEVNKSGNQSMIPMASQSLFVLDNKIPVEANRSDFEQGKRQITKAIIVYTDMQSHKVRINFWAAAIFGWE